MDSASDQENLIFLSTSSIVRLTERVTLRQFNVVNEWVRADRVGAWEALAMDTPPASYLDGYSLCRLPLDQSRMGPAQYKVLRPDGSECCYGVSLELAEEAIEADRIGQPVLVPPDVVQAMTGM